ncbi:MAG: nicotinate-nucleotide--dimethylbenzimidazole phosphoribosyltransferase [Deltaproteobacteria bacterium]|nr:nicotinate-nucleotide--dimethylbenzimidazole phosphoribosyltransferase [Deltaproteobacteria bacterium]
MQTLKNRLAAIEPLDEEAIQKAKERTRDLIMPSLALGRLHEISWRMAGIKKGIVGQLQHKVVMVAAGDHGVAEEGVSLYPQEVTRQMVLGFIRGVAAINVIAHHVGARVVVVDFGIKGEPDPLWLSAPDRFRDKKVAPGTNNIARGPAMTKEQAEEAILKGIEVFEEERKRGMDVIATGDMGIANTTASAAVICALTGLPPEEIAGRGTGLDNERLKKKVEVIKRALEINRPDPSDPLDVLAKEGGFEIGGICGWMLGGASDGLPVVVDGFISTAGAMLAVALEPKIKDYLFAGHLSEEKGHRSALEYLGLKPILDLGMRLGEGTGAALALPIIEAGVKLLAQISTFEEAGVSRSAG